MTSNTLSPEMVEAMKSVYKRFSQTYKQLWVNTVDGDMKAHIVHWATELNRHSIDPADMEKICNAVLDNPEFKKYPPTPAEFIAEAALLNVPSSEFLMAVKRSLQMIGSTYMGKSIPNTGATQKLWCERMEEEGLSPSDVVASVGNCLKQTRFSTFPPSLLDVVLNAHRLRVDPQLPLPEDALEESMTSQQAANPYIREAKRRTGAFRLKLSETGGKLSRVFAEHYSEVLAEASKGEFVPKDDKPEEKMAVEEPVNRAETKSALDDILSNW